MGKLVETAGFELELQDPPTRCTNCDRVVDDAFVLVCSECGCGPVQLCIPCWRRLGEQVIKLCDSASPPGV